ncbi:MAG: hypothetical protein M5U28_12320 [Sandaracinaceae bacterium]|nr:hypothetical protein [Sandaracinaceae bacterium]
MDKPTVLLVGTGERMKDALGAALERHRLMVESVPADRAVDRRVRGRAGPRRASSATRPPRAGASCSRSSRRAPSPRRCRSSS